MSAEQVIADALLQHQVEDEGGRPEDFDRIQFECCAVPVATALRAAGLLPGPDDIVVSREDVRLVVHGGAEDQTQLDQAVARLAAALSQPHPEETP